jgi:gluconate 2-dehydrogenase gamma chain
MEPLPEQDSAPDRPGPGMVVKAAEPASATPGPEPRSGPSRRMVIRASAAGAAGLALGAGGAGVVARTGRPAPPAWRFFTSAESALLRAVCEQIIPADEDGGATDADCINFIDRQLAGRYRRHQAEYRAGLECIQKTSQAMFAKDFQQLAWDQQAGLLGALEANRPPPGIWMQPPAGSFFAMLVRHTMQGFYGSPRHGGNRDYLSYRMLGLEYPRVMGRNRHA